MAKLKRSVVASKSTDRPSVTDERRYHYVEMAAYYIAERRGFDGGDPDGRWAQAELEIDRLLAEGQLNH
jgi:hypothetical protein